MRDDAASQSVARSHAAPTLVPSPALCGCGGFTQFREKGPAFSSDTGNSWLPLQAGAVSAAAAEDTEAQRVREEQLLWQRQWEQQPWRRRQLETEQLQQRQHAALMQH
eukprot:358262-Chlamydomonas_euryale.AAC.14